MLPMFVGRFKITAYSMAHFDCMLKMKFQHFLNRVLYMKLSLFLFFVNRVIFSTCFNKRSPTILLRRMKNFFTEKRNNKKRSLIDQTWRIVRLSNCVRFIAIVRLGWGKDPDKGMLTQAGDEAKVSH